MATVQHISVVSSFWHYKINTTYIGILKITPGSILEKIWCVEGLWTLVYIQLVQIHRNSDYTPKESSDISPHPTLLINNKHTSEYNLHEIQRSTIIQKAEEGSCVSNDPSIEKSITYVVRLRPESILVAWNTVEERKIEIALNLSTVDVTSNVGFCSNEFKTLATGSPSLLSKFRNA